MNLPVWGLTRVLSFWSEYVDLLIGPCLLLISLLNDHETIVNGLGHAGCNEVSATDAPPIVAENKPVTTVEPDVRNIWDHLRATSFTMPTEICSRDFCAVDNDLAMNAVITVAEIIELVLTPTIAPGPSEPDKDEEMMTLTITQSKYLLLATM